MNEVPTAAEINGRWIPAQAEAIEQALSKPGHAVAVLDAGSLLVTGGVLDRLRRKGFTVTAPSVE